MHIDLSERAARKRYAQPNNKGAIGITQFVDHPIAPGQALASFHAPLVELLECVPGSRPLAAAGNAFARHASKEAARRLARLGRISFHPTEPGLNACADVLQQWRPQIRLDLAREAAVAHIDEFSLEVRATRLRVAVRATARLQKQLHATVAEAVSLHDDGIIEEPTANHIEWVVM